MHLAILLDTSGSMDGSRIDAVKRTLHAARDLFQPTDRLTLVCFDDVATTVCRGLSMTESGKERFYERVDRITTKGCTNLSAGIEKLLMEQEDDRPYTGLVVLTDGHINRGITSAVGLRDMVSGLDAGPVTALGYGAEHNRTLLRDLAVRTRGAYTFVDSDEVLPVVMGDLVGGQRSRVLQGAAIEIDGQPNWLSAELDGDGARHVIGDIVPDRDYWIVFENADQPAAHPLTVTLTAAVGLAESVTMEIPDEATDVTGGAATLQVLRCRVAAVSAAVTNALESGQRPEDAYSFRLTVLREELATVSPVDPLVLRLRAQVAELLEAIEHAPEVNAWIDGGATTPTTVLARLASNTAQLSLQRGVASASIGDPIQPATMFSSPVQREASNTCRRNYNRDPQGSPRTP
jgi:hypothetical protein